MKDKIVEILREINPYVKIDIDTDLYEEVLDSLAIMVLINNVEEEYNIKIPMDEIELDDFSSVASIEAMIKKLKT